jgi:predicted RNA-binding protein with RPS1 domain
MFLDVGAIKDGLVHVKDVSDNYFVTDLEQKFSPGQDLDAWVKFVDPLTSKFGLQLFPLKDAEANRNQATQFDYGELHETQTVKGRVIKSSQYGVFVDINSGGTSYPMAYLHKRKMQMAKKQLKLHPWQVHPVGSEIKCHVFSVDKEKNRIQLTTYDPAEWEFLIPELVAKGDSNEDSELITDSEHPAYSNIASSPCNKDAVVQHSKRGRHNTVLKGKELEAELEESAGKLESAVSTDDEDWGEGVSSYYYNQEEMDRLLAETQMKLAEENGEKADINDGGSKENAEYDNSISTAHTNSTDNDEYIPQMRTTAKVTAGILNHGVEISIPELFDRLKNRQNKVSVKDVMEWSYMRGFVTQRRIDENAVKQLMRESGSPFGSINANQFEKFIEMLSYALSPKNCRNMEGGLPSADDRSTYCEPDLSEFQVAPKALPAAYSFASDPAGRTENSSSATSFAVDRFNELSGQESTEEILSHLFTSVSRGKPAISLEDIFEWEFIRSFIRNSDAEYLPHVNGTISTVFYKLAGKHRVITSGLKLHEFIDELCESRELELRKIKSMIQSHDKKPSGTPSSQFSGDEITGRDQTAKATQQGIVDYVVDKERLQNAFSPADISYSSPAEETHLRDTFDVLAEGAETMSLDQLALWELVQLLFSEVIHNECNSVHLITSGVV